jgi:hypothetical protein
MAESLHAINKWPKYLIGRHFKVQIDHDIQKHFLEKIISSEEKQKWVEKMKGFDFEIIYKKGKENVVVDAIFRIEEDSNLYSITYLIPM